MTKLFETTDRDEAHRKLEELIKLCPTAECRESGDTVTIWDEPYINPAIITVAPPPTSPPEPAGLKLKFSKEEMETIAKLVAEQLRGNS